MLLHYKHSVDADSGLHTVYNKCVWTQTETTEGRGLKVPFHNKRKGGHFLKNEREKSRGGVT